MKPAAQPVEAGKGRKWSGHVRAAGVATLRGKHRRNTTPTTNTLAKIGWAPDRGNQGETTGAMNWTATGQKSLTPTMPVHDGELDRRQGEPKISHRWGTAVALCGRAG
jgi:hypothetical protein